jgi:hypothetical protein
MRTSRQIIAALMLLVLLLQGGGVFWCALYAGSKAVQTLRTTRAEGVLLAIKQLNKSSGKCNLCKSIGAAKGKEDQQRSNSPSELSQLQSLVFSHDVREFEFSVALTTRNFPSLRISAWHSRADRPATPPPRTA